MIPLTLHSFLDKNLHLSLLLQKYKAFLFCVSEPQLS